MLATLLEFVQRGGVRAAALGALGSVFALQLSACTPQRPDGRYKGPALYPPEIDASGVATTEDSGVVLPPDSGNPMPGNPDGGNDSDAADAGDTADAGDPIDPVEPHASLEGDYLMRFDTVTESTQDNLGTVTTTTVAYGVMRVTRSDEALQGTEWLCHSDSNQTATKGNVTTIVSDEVWPRLAPVTRALEVDPEAGTWSSGPGTRRQGWKSTAKEMPRNVAEQEDLFLNPDGGYFGVNIRLQGRGQLAGLPAPFDCSYDVVSYATTRYVQATLDENGLFASAQVEVDDTEVFALRASALGTAPCRVSDINDAAPPSTPTDELTLAAVEGQWLPSNQESPTPCPDKSEFQSALP